MLLAIDTCTRWVIAEPIRDAKASTAADFMKKIILQHFPTTVQSDHGSEFDAEFKVLLQNAGIRHVQSTPRHARSNGMIERANKSISEIMRTIIVEKNHADWAEALPYALRCYNTSVHAVTRFSPYFLLYGCEPRIGNLMHETSASVENVESVIDVNEARRLAVERTKAYQKSQRRAYNKRRRQVAINAGDLVMVEISTMTKGQSKRFNARRRGPFEVLEVYNNNTLLIEDSRKAQTVVNAERCLKIRRRPEYLIYDIGVDSTIEQVVRGPDLSAAGESVAEMLESVTSDNFDSFANYSSVRRTSTSELPIDQEDAIVMEMSPFRRSSRQRKRPERLIEVMSSGSLAKEQIPGS